MKTLIIAVILLAATTLACLAQELSVCRERGRVGRPNTRATPIGASDVRSGPLRHRWATPLVRGCLLAQEGWVRVDLRQIHLAHYRRRKAAGESGAAGQPGHSLWQETRPGESRMVLAAGQFGDQYARTRARLELAIRRAVVSEPTAMAVRKELVFASLASMCTVGQEFLH
jgi:hypothetical protein